MPNSCSLHPLTTLSPQRPLPIWSSVPPIFAAINGWKIGTCTVEKTLILLVRARIAEAHVIVSSEVPKTLVTPPKPRHLAIGKRNSKPADSAAQEIFRFDSKVQS